MGRIQAFCAWRTQPATAENVAMGVETWSRPGKFLRLSLPHRHFVNRLNFERRTPGDAYRSRSANLPPRMQFDEKVSFQLATGGSSLWLTASGIAFDVLRPKEIVATVKAESPRFDRGSSRPKASDVERLVVSEDFVGANPTPGFEPHGPQRGIYNYLIGNDPAKWRTNVTAYNEVVYRNVWDGVDLRLYPLYPNESGLEQEFVLAPGGDASKIQVAYKGINTLKLADDGSLLILTAFGQWRESPPKVYQEIAGKRVAINAQMWIRTGLAVWPSAVSTTSTSPIPAKLRGSSPVRLRRNVCDPQSSLLLL